MNNETWLYVYFLFVASGSETTGSVYTLSESIKNLPANAGDMGSIPGEGNGNLLQYSCLGNPTHRGAWQATVHGVSKESDTT